MSSSSYANFTTVTPQPHFNMSNRKNGAKHTLCGTQIPTAMNNHSVRQLNSKKNGKMNNSQKPLLLLPSSLHVQKALMHSGDAFTHITPFPSCFAILPSLQLLQPCLPWSSVAYSIILCVCVCVCVCVCPTAHTEICGSIHRRDRCGKVDQSY